LFYAKVGRLTDSFEVAIRRNYRELMSRRDGGDPQIVIVKSELPKSEGSPFALLPRPEVSE
jgi:hypothetical protein